MIFTRVYLYDSTKESNNYKGEDYSKFALLGDSSTDNLDDTLDSYELTLVGLSFRDEFQPSTKFIIEKGESFVDDNENLVENIWKRFNLCVESDTVEQPVLSDDNYFTHHLKLYEAAVLAQKRLVDNISVTYNLKDVNLDEKPSYSTTERMTKNIVSVEEVPADNFVNYKKTGILNETLECISGHQFKWIMPDWYTVSLIKTNPDGTRVYDDEGNPVYETVTPSWEYWNIFLLNQPIPNGKSSMPITLPVPMLACYSSVKDTKTYQKNGFCSIIVKVTEENIGNQEKTEVLNMQVDPYFLDTNESWVPDNMFPEVNGKGWICSKTKALAASSSLLVQLNSVSKVAESADNRTNRVINFDIKPGYIYSISLTRKIFDLSNTDDSGYIPPINVEIEYDKYPAYFSRSYIKSIFGIPTIKNGPYEYVNDTYPIISSSFTGVQAGTGETVYLRTAPPANAYDLFNKAQLSTQNVWKKENVPVNETPTTFYLLPSDKERLQNTQIVENFYNQKNLWEIMLDVGKYIHARPVVQFGDDERFIVTWKDYGKTDQEEDTATPISIYNSRFIEEYVSACSSYVTNMVQLGGSIEEVVAPKSSSEDFLVYNDVAEIIVEKPIIQIDSLFVKNKEGAEKEITQYVYEESVYSILSINKDVMPNKGFAIYYKIGTNKIVGLTYQLPAVNQGDQFSDYAIKQIIGKAFGIFSGDWKDIKVNEYSFRIIYRTQDTLRSNQTRPDLRKYLLTSKYDRVPQHNQFNNQTDVVVDSVKFGTNIYGKLIRTGNTVYSKVEYVTSLFDLKNSGELYNIFGNLYYVSKVENTYYSDHVISKVEFSKDFNRLSEVIGIPSEPRFYEISERSSIDRELSFDDYFIITTVPDDLGGLTEESFINLDSVRFLESVLFESMTDYPSYAITQFKNDVDSHNELPTNKSFELKTMHPLSIFSIHNTITFEWDMRDNFSAGDQVVPTDFSIDTANVVDTAYNKLTPFRYKDVYGRVDMVDFALISPKTQLSIEDIQQLPKNPIDLAEGESYSLFFASHSVTEWSNTEGVITLLDNREVAKFNLNIQILSASDRFVFSSKIWSKKGITPQLALLRTEINKLSTDLIPNSDFIFERDKIELLTAFSPTDAFFKLRIFASLAKKALALGITVDELVIGAKAIVLYLPEDRAGSQEFVLGRNISGLNMTTSEGLSDWYFGIANKDIFLKQ